MTRFFKLAATVALAVGAFAVPAAALSSSPAAALSVGYPNFQHDEWGLFGTGPYACNTFDGHEWAYGGALAFSGTPDPYYGGNTCWSTYSVIFTVEGGVLESAGGSPSSAVVLACQHDSESYQEACFGLFDCAPDSVAVFLGGQTSEPFCPEMGPNA